MKIMAFDSGAEAALEAFRRFGGVIEYVAIDPEGADGASPDVHRVAAAMTMDELEARHARERRRQRERFPEYFASLPEFCGPPTAETVAARAAAARPAAERLGTAAPRTLDRAAFLGPNWSWAWEDLIIGDVESDWAPTGRYFALSFGKRGPTPPVTPGPTEGGYAYAFSDPPYRLYGDVGRTHRALRGPEIRALFDRVNGALFPNLFHGEFRAYQWPTDFDDYFDAGHEWWGSFLWTVYQPGCPLIGVAASATD